MEASRRIDDEHVGAPGLGCLIGVVGHRAWVGSGPVADYFYARPLAEDFQLLLLRVESS